MNMIQSAGCARRPLAGSEQCLVEECGCGSIHLTLGALTLRLAPATAADLSQTLAEAMQRWALSQLGGGRPCAAHATPGEGVSS
jgi:hypothetical protein